MTTLLQCFDTVGRVIRHVKSVGRITYNYCVGADVKPCSINQSKYQYLSSPSKLLSNGWASLNCRDVTWCDSYTWLFLITRNVKQSHLNTTVDYYTITRYSLVTYSVALSILARLLTALTIGSCF